GRPVDVIDVDRIRARYHRTGIDNFRLAVDDFQVGHREHSIVCAPSDMLAIGADVRPAPWNAEIVDSLAAGLDGQDAVPIAHPRMDCGDEPLAAGHAADIVQVV